MKTNRTAEHVKLIKSTHVERASQALAEVAGEAFSKGMVGFAIAGLLEDGSVTCQLGGLCVDNESAAIKVAARLYHAMLYQS